jgi:UDP-N-acetylglucosamine 1-carboxyvinyltransferase
VTATEIPAETTAPSPALPPLANAVRVGALVRDARRHRGLTQQQLAERLGTSQSAVARIEQGGQNLTLELLGRLSEALESELISVGPAGPTCGSPAAPRCGAA